MRLPWTGPPALACFARTGWDTSPALIALTVLLHATEVYQSMCNKKNSVLLRYSTLVAHLNKVWSVILSWSS